VLHKHQYLIVYNEKNYFQNDVATTPLQSHFQQVIERAPLDHDGEENN